jgi:transcriptional regulator of acetoin/glycerol metabolism
MVALLVRPGTGLHHVDRVQAVVDGATATSELDVSSSWDRCVTEHGLDPEAKEPPRILTSRELKDHRQPLDQLIAIAAAELDRLHAVVGQARYIVLLCDARGVAVDYRVNAAYADLFRHWGIYLGGVWDEKVEGTNGIGTSIAELRSITVHRSQHFRCRHIDLSCSSAPIMDGDGRLLAILDVSCFDPTLSDRAHALAGALVRTSARAIEKQYVERSATLSRSGQFYQRGGLPPGALKRVREYVDSHLAERLSVERLAAIAGLSVYHFARAFKKSQGVTPHDYLLDRRISRAQALLDATDTALSDIALVSGFADQSHFARHFRQRVGIPPSVYRRSQRHAPRR